MLVFLFLDHIVGTNSTFIQKSAFLLDTVIVIRVFKCLHPSGRLYISRHVSFNEEEFPYRSLFAKDSNIGENVST